MRYDLEEIAKARLYMEFREKNYVKGETERNFQQYVREMIKYVEENFRIRYAELLKQHGE